MRETNKLRAAALVAMVAIAACSVALGQDAAAPAEKPGFWSGFLNSTFGLVLLFIFIPVIITTFIAARQRDRCLKTFHGFHITVVTTAGRTLWGRLRVFSKGIVIHYRSPIESEGRPVHTSYMMYEPDMENVRAVFRFHDQLDKANKKRRTRQVRRLAYPGLFLRLWRRTRNLINTLRDALNKAIGAILGQAQRARPGSKMLKAGGKEIGGVGATLLGRVANAYEPLLESHIGTPVVLEVTGPGEGEKTEYGGQLGEYSAGYLMVLDIDAEIEEATVVGGPGAFDGHVTAETTGDQIQVTNGLGVKVRVVAVDVGDRATPVSEHIPAGAAVTLAVSVSEIAPAPAEAPDAAAPSPPPITVRLTARRSTDVMAPRARAIVRHGGLGKEDHIKGA